MARLSSDEWPVRRRIAEGLPAMLVDDEFVQRLCAGLDEVLASVPGSLDNFDAFLDPELSPEDFLDYLGSWVGVELDPAWPLERRRTLVAGAVARQARRGTAGALADLVEIVAGARPTIIEGGGTAWSPTPGAALPGRNDAGVTVRLPFAEPAPGARARLDRLVKAHIPAHLTHRLEFALPAPLPPPGPER